jgi:endonuclease/exonuclease/phosphatase family metal-dependent hydrolase
MKEERRKEDKEKTRYALGTKEGEQESSTSTTKKIKKNALGKQGGILEIGNWNEIIDNHTILAGDFNAHDPLWGSHKTKDSSHIKNLIEQYKLKICNNFQPTRMGYDNQQPSIIDLTLTAGPTINNWTTLDDNEYHTPSDHRAIS